MSGWADASASLAGAVVFIVGALTPHIIDAAERRLDAIGQAKAQQQQQPPETPPPS